ncbi:recombination protein NinB [Acinetobacter corruptisaponis]|uniref:Recombination protein NinB n=1 Tax=Acinetobacter corruptisaponis TaxID=3045147 RepID=A0ABY8SAR9_9GAMM|nr:recombination protein NinB [Acinetobacter sp. KCTC 92772]WHP06774.1 recombination protein NinB [Acinetobacter sp. KCTC 92772]
MTTAVFTIPNHAEIAKVINYLNTHHAKAAVEGKPLVVEIRPETKDRSKAQNRLYWKWLHEIHRKTGNDEDQLHFEFKKKFLISILKRDDKDYANMCLAISALKQSESEQFEAIANGVIRETSTTRMDTKQFTEYLNLIEAYALKEFGLVLPVPDDLKYVME